MKFNYPVVIRKEKKDYIAYVPDLNINTFGKTFDEAINMVYDAIGMVYITREDKGLKIKKPSKLEKISNMPEYKKHIVTHIDIDTNAFREANDTKSVRRNITLPSWLDKYIRKRKINVSKFLQESFKEKFELKYA